jgi:hypothetical protein
MPSSSLDLDKSTSRFQMERYAVTLIVILLMSSLRSPAIGGDVDPAVKRTSLLKDGWADYLGEVVRYEDCWNEWDTE